MIELKGGGRIVGVVVEKNAAGQHIVRTDDGVTVAVERSDIARLIDEDPKLAVYRQRARKTADTAKAHLELARWCDEQKLFERRDHHYRRVLQLDPEDPEARMELGYKKYGSKWLTRDELLESRGLNDVRRQVPHGPGDRPS